MQFIILTGIVHSLNQSAYGNINEKIANRARLVGRNPDSVTLLAVSKTFQIDEIVPVLEAGAKRFAENRVQEAMAKWPDLKQQFDDVELHLIGPLQSNKARDAVRLFEVIHTVDREKIAATIAREMDKQQKKLKLFVQVNTGDEEQKTGILPQDAVEFVDSCRSRYGLEISGLMCIPPFDENPGPHFALLRKLAEECSCEKLSMGMSDDFETAIDFGATHVRIGRAIFGDRR